MAKRPLDFQMGVEDDVLAQLRLILETAAAEIEQELSASNGDGIGAALQRAQAEAIAKAVKQHLKGDWDSISSVLSEARKMAAMASVEAFYDQISDPLGELLGKDGVNSLISSESVRAANTINTVMARLSESRRSLSQQVWSSQAMANGWLDSKINQALARGWDSKRLAKEVVAFVDPNSPGGASYAAMRLARTEINNAFHSQTIDQMRRSGVVEYVKWNLSRSHPDHDICDDLAEHRLGEPTPGLKPDEPDSQAWGEARLPNRANGESLMEDFGYGHTQDEIDAASGFAKDSGMSISGARSRMLEAIENGPVVQISEDSLRSVLGDGRMKNVHESLSTGSPFTDVDSYIKKRSLYENETMGVPKSAKPKEYPIYGHGVDPSSKAFAESGLSGYGAISIIPKRSVLERTSWTFGDSLDNKARPLFSSEISEASELDILTSGLIQSAEIASTFGNSIKDEYIEAQIFGGISVGDIDRVVVGNGFNISKDIEDKLSKLGIGLVRI